MSFAQQLLWKIKAEHSHLLKQEMVRCSNVSMRKQLHEVLFKDEKVFK